jgi:hypothetical protein
VERVSLIDRNDVGVNAEIVSLRQTYGEQKEGQNLCPLFSRQEEASHDAEIKCSASYHAPLK